MIYNTQTDKKWCNETMTKSEEWDDKIGRYGCLVTSLANALQVLIGNEITPTDLNMNMKLFKGYTYLKNPNCKESEASNLEWDVIEKLFKDKLTFVKYCKPIDIMISNQIQYIARIIHPLTKSGHYVNLIYPNWIFDVEDGKIKYIETEKLTLLHKVVKI